MKITKVAYSRGMTVNVGNFENVRVDISMEADIGNSASYEDALQDLKSIVDDKVRREVRAIHNRAERRDNG